METRNAYNWPHNVDLSIIWITFFLDKLFVDIEAQFPPPPIGSQSRYIALLFEGSSERLHHWDTTINYYVIFYVITA